VEGYSVPLGSEVVISLQLPINLGSGSHLAPKSQIMDSEDLIQGKDVLHYGALVGGLVLSENHSYQEK
jgi:hypothetical protein